MTSARLALDGVGPGSSIALQLDDASPRQVEDDGRPGSVLHVLIADLLHDHELPARRLTQVAVVRGPGSFTGLRVALAAGLGLDAAGQIELVGIDSLSAIAWESGLSGRFGTVLDGGFQRCFLALHERSGDDLTTVDSLRDLAPAELPVVLDELGVSELAWRGPRPDDLTLPSEPTLVDGPLALAALTLARNPEHHRPPEPLYGREPHIRPAKGVHE
ncbi:MAG: tRNA (adenosine(37)-N6)-threonylcarbamoyltransferase complex dimerization subunit type 1 TsaB [Acidobacteriota bacterium]